MLNVKVCASSFSRSVIMLLSGRIENCHLMGVKILVFIIPFIPLYISSEIFFPYITGKNFAFRVLVELAAALWLSLICYKKEYRPQKSKILFSVLVFTFIVGLADLTSVNPYKSFWSNYERMEGYITILHLALYFIILKSIFRAPRDWSVYLNVIFIAGTFAGLYAMIPQANTSIAPRYFIEYGTRISGTLGNPPFLASYLLLIVSIGFILLLRTQNTFLKVFYLIAVLLDLAAIYLTASRGAILAAMFGAVFFCLFSISGKFNSRKERRFNKTALKYTALLVLAVLIITFVYAGFTGNEGTIQRFASIFSDRSVETRIDAWKIAWAGIKERPVLGWGQENFLSLYTIVPIPFIKEQVWVDRAHNILIHWLVNAGILGLCSYLMIFGSAVAALFKAVYGNIIKKKEAAVIITALSVYLIQNLFTFDTINTYMVFFALLAYIDSLDPYEGLTSEVSSGFSEERYFIPVGSLFIALLSFLLFAYLVNYKPIKQAQIAKQSSVILPEGDSYAELLDDFRLALSYRTFGDTYVRRQMSSVANGIYIRKLFEHKGALLFIRSATSELFNSISGNRNNLAYLTNVINYSMRFAVYQPSLIEKTEELIKACIRLNPEYQWLYVALSDIYIMKKDYEGAYALAKQTLTNDPLNDILLVKLALTAILTKRNEVAESVMEKAGDIRVSRKTQIPEDNELLFSAGELHNFAKAYREVKNYGMVLKYYREMLNIEPFNARLHFEIAEIYYLIGDRMNAEKETEKAEELTSGNYADDLGKSLIQ